MINQTNYAQKNKYNIKLFAINTKLDNLYEYNKQKFN